MKEDFRTQAVKNVGFSGLHVCHRRCKKLFIKTQNLLLVLFNSTHMPPTTMTQFLVQFP